MNAPTLQRCGSGAVFGFTQSHEDTESVFLNRIAPSSLAGWRREAQTTLLDTRHTARRLALCAFVALCDSNQAGNMRIGGDLI
jgi:hypothetical protein